MPSSSGGSINLTMRRLQSMWTPCSLLRTTSHRKATINWNWAAVENLCSLPGSLGLVDILSADTGYFSQSNVEECKGKNIVPYIAAGREQHNASLEDRFTEPAPLLGPADPVTEMKHRLKTIVGKAIYAKRKSTVEPVFGIIKAVMGFRQFLLRGLKKVAGEWDWSVLHTTSRGCTP